MSGDNISNDTQVDTKDPENLTNAARYNLARCPKTTAASGLPHPKFIVNKSSTLNERNCTSGSKVVKTRALKRRSAIPAIKRTPRYQVNKDIKSQTLSKVTSLSGDNNLQRRAKVRAKMEQQPKVKKCVRSVIEKDIPEIIVHPPESGQVAGGNKMPEMKDASTCTQYLFPLGKSPNKDLRKEIDDLVEEQGQLCEKARLIHEQTMERRKNMEESHLVRVTQFVTILL